MDVHVRPQGGFDLVFIQAGEFVELSDSLAKLEPVGVVHMVLKHTQTKWMMWHDIGDNTTIRTIIHTGFYLL